MKFKKLKRYAATTNLKSSDNMPEGGSGVYFKLPHGVGVKIYRYDTPRTNPYKVIGTYNWWKASQALNNMKVASKTGLAPKGFCVAPVKLDGKYYVGLFMEHVEGEHKNISHRKLGAIVNRLEKHGIYHRDLHEQNMIVKGDKSVAVIDWDDEFVCMGRRYNQC